jgi:cytochrome c oxidase subunit 2
MAAALAVFFWVVAAATVGIFLGRVWWLPELVSAHGRDIDRQLTLTLWCAGIVFFLAQAALGYLLWRYRAQRGRRAEHWHENRAMEATWTIATLVLFVGLALLGNRVWAGYVLTQAPGDAVMIEVTGQQFAWNIRYPGPDGKFGRTDVRQINDALGNFIGVDASDPAGADDIVAQNIIAVPVNRPVRVMLRSKDVTHALYIPHMRVKQDAVPGMQIGVNFTAGRTGEFEVACAELCGMQHYKMRARLLVMQADEFERWLKNRS